MGCVSSKALKGKKGKDGSEYQKVCILRGDQHDIPRKTIPQVWKELLEGNKDLGAKTALKYEGKDTTFEELDKQSDAVAKALAKEVERKENELPVVGVLMPCSDTRVITLLGAMKAYLPFLPLETVLPKARMQYIVKAAKANVVVTTKEYGDTAQILSDCCKVLYYEDLLAQESEGSLPESKDQNPVVAVYYTSGSTGYPKGVPLRARSILNRLMWQWHQFPYTDNEVACQKTSLLFIDSLTEILGSILKGVTLAVAPKGALVDPEELISFMDEQKVTQLIVVPTLLQSMLSFMSLYEKGEKLESLRNVISSGEELSTGVALEFFERFPGQRNLINFYGCTEVTGDVTFETYTKESDVKNKTVDNHISIGAPIWNTTVYVMDENMKPVRTGETGEMYICGHSVCEKYLDGTNSDKIIENPDSKSNDDTVFYRTGDYVTVVGNRLIYRGRTDNMLKIRGQRFDLSEVDRVLGEVSGVKESATLAASRTESGVQIIAFYTTDEDDVEQLEKNMKQACEDSLPSYAQPRFQKLPFLPQTASGKLDRQQLLKDYCNIDIAAIEDVIPTVRATVTNLVPDKPEIEQYVTKAEEVVVAKAEDAVETAAAQVDQKDDSGLMGSLGGFLSSDKKDDKSGGGMLGGIGGLLSSDKKDDKSGGGLMSGGFDGIKKSVGNTALQAARSKAEELKADLAKKYPMIKNIPLDVVFKVISEKLGISPVTLKPESNFFSLGGTSSTASEMVSSLKEEGVKAKVGDLLGSENIAQFLGTLGEEGVSEVNDRYAAHFETWVIDENVDYDHLCKMTAKAFTQRNKPIAKISTEEALCKLFQSNKKVVIDAGISSYIVDKRSSKTVACSINYDDERPFEQVPELKEFHSFLDAHEKDLKDFLKGKYGEGKWLASFSNIVDVGMDGGHALYLMKMLEDETVNVANNRGYDGIRSINMHEATLALSEETGYTVYKRFKVNDGELDGKKVFADLDKDYFMESVYMHIDYDDEGAADDQSKEAKDTKL